MMLFSGELFLYDIFHIKYKIQFPPPPPQKKKKKIYIKAIFFKKCLSISKFTPLRFQYVLLDTIWIQTHASIRYTFDFVSS